MPNKQPMHPLNPLYEVVPFTPETTPDKAGEYIAFRTCRGNWESLYFINGKWKQWEGRADRKDYDDITHYLRPYNPEELVKTIAPLIWKAAEQYHCNFDATVTIPDLQTFTDNLLNEMRK